MIVSQYSTTPMFLDKEVFSPYPRCSKCKIRKKAHYDVIKYQNNKFYSSKNLVGEGKILGLLIIFNLKTKDLMS